VHVGTCMATRIRLVICWYDVFTALAANTNKYPGTDEFTSPLKDVV